jgi:ATP-dependent Clp protease, protease subunit
VPRTAASAALQRAAYVHFTREINGDTAEALLDSVTGLANDGVQRVVLCIASPGGWTAKATAAYNLLRALPISLVTYNIGEVASAANMLFLAGDERYACPHATFMLHPGSFTADAGKEFDAKIMRERIVSLDAHDERERLIVKQRTKLTAARVKKLVDERATLSASDALKAGIVHGVKPLKIPAGARLVTASAQPH